MLRRNIFRQEEKVAGFVVKYWDVSRTERIRP
jgi:hypothetical protein